MSSDASLVAQWLPACYGLRPSHPPHDRLAILFIRTSSSEVLKFWAQCKARPSLELNGAELIKASASCPR